VFVVIPSPIAKVQAAQKRACLVNNHNLFVMRPQEHTDLSMVRVSKHLHTAAPTLTHVSEEKKMKIHLMHLQ
jgi:hypothetical protein